MNQIQQSRDEVGKLQRPIAIQYKYTYLYVNTICHREVCTRNGLNDRDIFIGEQYTIIWLSSGWSVKIHGI